MAAKLRSNIPDELRRLFPTRWLNATAREVGLVERRRKVAPERRLFREPHARRRQPRHRR